jgi:hypothetical protein
MKIQQLNIKQKRLSNAEAELSIVVEIDSPNDTTQIRGQLSGPRCPNAETVQLAYPLKQIQSSGNRGCILTGKIVVPEPNLWTAEMPFGYEGKVELWHEGKLLESRQFRVVFKAS